MELAIKGIQIIFSLRISVFIADMLEANAITYIYKLANCKMPYSNCIIHIKNLNNMKIPKKNIILRIPESIDTVI